MIAFLGNINLLRCGFSPQVIYAGESINNIQNPFYYIDSAGLFHLHESESNESKIQFSSDFVGNFEKVIHDFHVYRMQLNFYSFFPNDGFVFPKGTCAFCERSATFHCSYCKEALTCIQCFVNCIENEYRNKKMYIYCARCEFACPAIDSNFEEIIFPSLGIEDEISNYKPNLLN